MPKQQENLGTSPDAELRRLLSEAIKRSGKKRLQIAEEMSADLPGFRVTEPMLNDFTSLRKSAARFPASFVKAFCKAVGCTALQTWLLDDESLRLIQVGRHVRECRDQARKLEAVLTELDAPQARPVPRSPRKREPKK